MHGKNAKNAEKFKRKRYCPIKINKEIKKSNYAGNWIGVGVALGALIFVLTSEPLWIGVGVAIGAALDWKRPKK